MSEIQIRTQHIASITRFDQSPLEFTEFLRQVLNEHQTRIGSWRFLRAYRVRKDKCKSVGDIWYCPPAKSTSIGRFNRPYSAMLYMSDNPASALKEVNAKIGEVISLGIIKPKEPDSTSFMLTHLGMSNNRIGNCIDRMKNDPNLNLDHISQIVKANPDNWIDHLNLKAAIDLMVAKICTDEFEFCSDYHKYEYTNALWEIYRKIPELEGLVYPSIAADLSSVNLAILPDSADGKLKLEGIIEFEMTEELCEVKSDDFSATLERTKTRCGIPNMLTGEIQWET